MLLQEGIVDTRELRYGDEIVLSELRTLALLRSSAGLGSYLYADELAMDVPHRDTNSTPGIHECTFRLCVHQEHQAQDEFNKAITVNRLSPDNWRAELGAGNPLYTGISVLAHEAEQEKHANDHRNNTSRGRVIAYGERVQLCHSWSGGIMTAIREPSEQNPQGILIQLVRKSDEGAWFTVQSPGKALQHGDRVRNNAEIVLESVRYPGRYAALNVETASLDARIEIEESLLPHSYISRRLECFLGFHQQSWAVRIFRREAASAASLTLDTVAAGASALVIRRAGAYTGAALEERRIVGTDIVQLYHRDDDALLVVETPTRAGANLPTHHKPQDRGVAFFMPLKGRQQVMGEFVEGCCCNPKASNL